MEEKTDLLIPNCLVVCCILGKVEGNWNRLVIQLKFDKKETSSNDWISFLRHPEVLLMLD
jgi:hypothetical protein